MPTRRRLVRSLTVAGLLVAGPIAVVGGLSLRAPGLVAVAVAGALAACLGYGMARETTEPRRRSLAESATLAAGWTVGTLLVLCGTSVLAGGAAAAMLAGLGAAGMLVLWVLRSPHGDTAAERPAAAAPGRSEPLFEQPVRPWGDVDRREPARGAARVLPPVAVLPTDAIGSEWLESTALLEGTLQPADRASLALRRQELLDELERRDAAGFLRWMAAGPGADPATFVRGNAGESAADAA